MGSEPQAGTLSTHPDLEALLKPVGLAPEGLAVSVGEPDSADRAAAQDGTAAEEGQAAHNLVTGGGQIKFVAKSLSR
jgi:hypothetical protein